MRGRDARPARGGARVAQLEITVVNGDLTFEERPLLVGHYRATRLTGTEKVIDRLLDRRDEQRARSRRLSGRAGHAPDLPESRQIPTGKFWQTPRPEAVIVAGLGQEGKLQSAHIVHTVRQAVIAWAERVAEERRADPRAARARDDPAGQRRHRRDARPGRAADRAGRVRGQRADSAHRRAKRLPQVRELRVHRAVS